MIAFSNSYIYIYRLLYFYVKYCNLIGLDAVDNPFSLPRTLSNGPIERIVTCALIMRVRFAVEFTSFLYKSSKICYKNYDIQYNKIDSACLGGYQLNLTPLENHCQPPLRVGWQWFSRGVNFNWYPPKQALFI